MENQNRLIDEFHKNSQERIRISQTKFRDRDLIDIRVWVQGKTIGEFDQVTKKGLTISVLLLTRLLEALQKAQKVLETEQKEPEFKPEKPQGQRSHQDEGKSSS